MKNILVAVDFSDVTTRIIAEAQKLAQAFSAKIWLLHTEMPHEGFIYYQPGSEFDIFSGFGIDPIEEQQILSRRMDNDRDALDSLVKQLQKHGLIVEADLMAGPTVELILAHAEKAQADLIIVGAHQHNRFYHLVIGSVESQLLIKSQCPILIIPAAG